MLKDTPVLGTWVSACKNHFMKKDIFISYFIVPSKIKIRLYACCILKFRWSKRSEFRSGLLQIKTFQCGFRWYDSKPKLCSISEFARKPCSNTMDDLINYGSALHSQNLDTLSCKYELLSHNYKKISHNYEIRVSCTSV